MRCISTCVKDHVHLRIHLFIIIIIIIIAAESIQSYK